jgi:hypothetical protein
VLYLTGHSSAPVRDVARELGLGLLLQPGNSYAKHVDDYVAWALDNAMFSAEQWSWFIADLTGSRDRSADEWLERYEALLTRLEPHRTTCLFVVIPDTPGDCEETLWRLLHVAPILRRHGFPVAFVAQDGLEEWEIPWGLFDVLFIGGTDAWRASDAPGELIAEAKLREKRVHWGRVNSYRALQRAADLGADTADGTFLAFAPSGNIPRLRRWLEKLGQGSTRRTEISLEGQECARKLRAQASEVWLYEPEELSVALYVADPKLGLAEPYWVTLTVAASGVVLAAARGASEAQALEELGHELARALLPEEAH